MPATKKSIKRPTGLHPLIAFQDEKRTACLRDWGEWMPWIAIYKAGRSWIVEINPFEGGDRPRYLTPLGAAIANQIAHLGDRIFNSVFSLHGGDGYIAVSTDKTLHTTQPRSCMFFKAPSLAIACTVASRLLFLPEECFTDVNDEYLPNDPIHRILSVVQERSRTDIKPFIFDEPVDEIGAAAIARRRATRPEAGFP